MNRLPEGLIYQVARAGDLLVREKNGKAPLRCPFHDDRHASAVLIGATNCFHCSLCTPDTGWSAKRLAEELKLDWKQFVRDLPRNEPVRQRATRPEVPAFGAKDAQATWTLAYARTRDDTRADEDAHVYRYVAGRGLMESWELGCFGVLTSGMPLHNAVEDWAVRGYPLISPLYDVTGVVANVQARAIGAATPKTLFPSGSKAAGTLFADRRGQAVLQGSDPAAPVLFGEGLTDFLALSIASPIAVLSAPGTSMCAGGVGPWVRDRELYVAVDCDSAGEGAARPTSDAAYHHGARNVRRVVWPGHAKDAGDVVASHGVVALEAFLRSVVERRTP